MQHELYYKINRRLRLWIHWFLIESFDKHSPEIVFLNSQRSVYTSNPCSFLFSSLHNSISIHYYVKSYSVCFSFLLTFFQELLKCAREMVLNCSATHNTCALHWTKLYWKQTSELLIENGEPNKTSYCCFWKIFLLSFMTIVSFWKIHDSRPFFH